MLSKGSPRTQVSAGNPPGGERTPPQRTSLRTIEVLNGSGPISWLPTHRVELPARVLPSLGDQKPARPRAGRLHAREEIQDFQKNPSAHPQAVSSQSREGEIFPPNRSRLPNPVQR